MIGVFLLIFGNGYFYLGIENREIVCYNVNLRSKKIHIHGWVKQRIEKAV